MTRRRAAMSAIATRMFASDVHGVADVVLHHGTLGFLAHRGLVIVPDTLIAECAEELRSFLDLDEVHPGVGLPRSDGRIAFVYWIPPAELAAFLETEGVRLMPTRGDELIVTRASGRLSGVGSASTATMTGAPSRS